jgi:uncharacterized protein YutE (UPF0331/DUF86 family)
LQEVIEACLDIANHVIASREMDRAEEYSEMFEILGDEDILDEQLADNLSDMAKFRNLLVHRYGDIENEKLRIILDGELGDIRDYLEQINQELFDS